MADSTDAPSTLSELSTTSASSTPSISSRPSTPSTPSTVREVSTEPAESVKNPVTQSPEPPKHPEIMRLGALLGMKLLELGNEETRLVANTDLWTRLAFMHKELKEEFPKINEPIDLSSPEAEELIACATLMVKNDLATVRMQNAMKENYKQIRKMLDEAQGILDQLTEIDGANEVYKEIEDALKRKNCPKKGWERLIKKLAFLIHHTGT